MLEPEYPPLHPHSHGPSYHNESKPEQYFPLSELVFYVEHDSEPSAEELLNNEWLINALPEEPPSGEGDCYQLSAEVKASFIEVPSVHFPTSGVQKSFTIFCLRSGAMNVVQELSNFYGFSSNYEGLSLKEGKGVVRWVLPNWFNGAAYHKGIGSHGPGGPPCPVTDIAIIDGLNASIGPVLETEAEAISGKVVVYILDTLPNPCRIQNALSTWPLLRQHFENILDVKTSVIGTTTTLETSKATYHYADPVDFAETYFHDDPNVPDHPYALGNHEYDSSDHGLFIAGIVHQFAPEVPMHVIQVMNDFGVGTFTTFANGFLKVVELHQALNLSKDKSKLDTGYRAIVNCSFTLSIPIDEHAPHHIPIDERRRRGMDEALVEWIRHNQELFNSQMRHLIEAMSASLDTGAIIVGAAGNDSVAGSAGKKTRYPAKFKRVVGVGAIKRDGSRAHYSNINDAPPSDGVYMFGGDYQDCTANSEGIISIFTGNLNIDLGGSNAPALNPGIFVNPTGYASWQGTSFATPMLGGVLAKISRRRNKNPRRVYDEDIKPLANANRAVNNITIDHN